MPKISNTIALGAILLALGMSPPKQINAQECNRLYPYGYTTEPYAEVISLAELVKSPYSNPSLGVYATSVTGDLYGPKTYEKTISKDGWQYKIVYRDRKPQGPAADYLPGIGSVDYSDKLELIIKHHGQLMYDFKLDCLNSLSYVYIDPMAEPPTLGEFNMDQRAIQESNINIFLGEIRKVISLIYQSKNK